MNESPYRGAEQLELIPCPHCGASSMMLPSDSLRWVCGVCGVPEIPGVDMARLPRRAVVALAGAGREHAHQVLRRRFALAVLTLAAVALTLFASWGRGVVAFLVGMPVVSLAALYLLHLTPAQIRRRTDRLLDEAWVDAAVLLASSPERALTARRFAEATRIPLDDAEHILSQLSLRGARVDVTDDAEVHYRIDAPLPDELDLPAPPRLHERR